MTPPDITLAELLPSLLVYRWIKLIFTSKDIFFELRIFDPIDLIKYLLSLTFCLGVSGNILIIATVMKKSSFKCPTNTFLASLASADLILIVVCLPVKVRRVNIISAV